MAQRHYRKRKRKTVRRFLLKIMLCAMMCLAFVVGATVFFKVETISVEGNGHYTAEEIISATNIQLGANLFSIKQDEISKSITYSLPYVQSIDIKLQLPTGIKLEVQEQIGMVQLVTEEGIWYMGVQGKLLELVETPSVETVKPWEEAPELSEEVQEEVSEEFTENLVGDVVDETVEAVMEDNYSPELLSAGEYQESSPENDQSIQQFLSLPWTEDPSYNLDFDPEEGSVIVVTGISPVNPVAGNLIEVAEEDNKPLQSLLYLFEELEEQNLFQEVETIKIHDFNYFEFYFNNRFYVKIPFTDDYDYKLRALMAAVSDIESYETGIMDLTQQHYVVLFTPD